MTDVDRSYDFLDEGGDQISAPSATRPSAIRPVDAPLPCDIDAQKSVTVVALSTPNALGDSLKIAPWNQWFGATWQRIARATVETIEAGQVPDVTSVGRWLKAHEQFGDIQAEMRELAQLADFPYVGNAEQHAREIHDHYVRRIRIQVEQRRLAQLREGKRPIGDVDREAEEQLAALIGPDEPKKPRVHVLGPSEIFALLPPIQWVVQGLDLCPGAPSLFAGYGYSGKSMVLQSMALQLAAGSPVWGAFTAVQGACVHLDYEQGEHLTRLRYQRLAYASDLAPQDLGDRLSLVCHPRFYLDEPEAESILLELCAGKSMAVVDSFRAACRSTDENSSEARVPLDMLGRISEQTGCAFAVIHHARKPNVNAVGGARDSIRGSGALYDACGSVFVLEGQPDDPERTIHHVKARVSGKTQEPMTLRIEDEGEPGSDGAAPGIRVTVSKAPSSEEKSKQAIKGRFLKLQEEVRSLFAESAERKGGVDAIAKDLGRKASDVRSAVNVMVETGELIVTGTTTNRGYQYVGT